MLDRGRLRATARLWWRMMRMQRVTREGWFYVLFTLVVGAAAINTGNNLLYLVLGLQLSLILLSAMLSETVLRGVEVGRELPERAVAGESFRVRLRVRNHKRRFASYSLVITEDEGRASGVRVFVAHVPPEAAVESGYSLVLPLRGEHRFGRVRITTRFPFGLFEKSREAELPDSLRVAPPGLRAPQLKTAPLSGAGERPEPRPGTGQNFHALRDYREGDDPRTIHWRSSARMARLISTEKERERRRRITLCVDGRGAAGFHELDGAADAVVGLARRYLDRGCEVGLSYCGGSLPPASGPGALRRIADEAALLSPAPPDAPEPRVHPGAHAIRIPLEASSEESPEFSATPLREPVSMRRRSGLTLHRAQRASLLAAVVAGFVSLAISGELPIWAGALFGGAVLLGLVLKEGGARSIRNASNFVAMAALLLLTLQVFTGKADVIVAAPTFAAVLAASRLLGRRGPIDDALLLLSSLLMLAGGAALTGDLSYGAAFSAFALTATVALCLSHLRREVEAVEGEEASRRPGTVSGAMVGALSLLSVTVLAGSVAVFVTFPRVSAGVIRRAMQDRTAGQSDRIELGGVGILKDDPTPVMRVRFPDGEEPAGELYWRTQTFERWDGKGWVRGEVSRTALDSQSWIVRIAPPRFGREIVADLEVLETMPSLPLPGEPLELRFPRRRGAPPPLIVGGSDGSIALRSAGSGDLRFRVTAEARPPDGALPGKGRAYPEEVLRYLHVPEDLDPRVVELARAYADEEPMEVVRALVRRFADDFRYSRELPGDVSDPLAHFLFDRREGHCEYFASALTLLLRLNGVPARVAAGFYGASWVEAGEYWVVRQGDAHAWTEAYFPGEGWVRFDATPASVRAGEVEGAWASVVEWIDVARAWWSQWVLDFDSGKQRSMVRALASALAGRAGAGARLAPLARVIVGLLALGVALWLSVRLLRRLLREDEERISPRHREAVSLYREVKRELRRRGVSLPPSATSSEWAEAAARVAPEKANVVRAAIRVYEGSRFGNGAFDPEEARRIRRGLRAS